MIFIKLWVDDTRPAPEGYVWCHSVWRAIKEITIREDKIKEFGDIEFIEPITLISLDHDAGDYFQYGGDYIQLLNWLEETGRNYPIRIHSMNVVGRMNMEAICRRNNWTIVD